MRKVFQYLKAGLVDELHIASLLLDDGIRLLGDISCHSAQERVRV